MVPAFTLPVTPSLIFLLNPRELRSFFGQDTVPDLAAAGSTFLPSSEPDVTRCLETLRPEVLVTGWSTKSLPADWLGSTDCSLKYICHLTGSVRELVPRVFLERGGLVTNWGSLVAPQVAEHALLLALAALRNLPSWGPGSLDCKDTTRTLFGKTVGLHGFGKIARSLRELLRPFGVRVLSYSKGVPADYMTAHGVEPCASLPELFANSAVLFGCEALTGETARSVTAEVLAALPDGAVFVNVGRGKVVDEPALIREAESGRLRIALDVVAHEPLPPDSPLARLPNVIYSPHIAGPTGDQFIQCGRQALENLDRYFHQLPLEAQVTLEIYDRST